jgi:DNA invertase Pin-like site-specific DNA recombinase
MNGTQPVKCAIWARVSSTDGSQTTENQLFVLREWAARRGFEVAREFITEDSAWANGNGAKGKEFDRQRTALKAGAKRGEYSRVLIWSLDRLSRRGIKDTIGILDDLADAGAIVCSHQETWTETTDRRMQELIISVMSWMAEMESSRRSERIKAGMARAKREGQQVGGRTAGSKDRRRRETSGYQDAWAPGGALRVAREAQIAAKRAAQENGSGEDQDNAPATG